MKKLNEILGTEFPMIQGGMANIATGEFAARLLQRRRTGDDRHRRLGRGTAGVRRSTGPRS